MTEDEVNTICKEWLEGQGYHYKGILNQGQVPVPDGYRHILIDHQGVRDNPIDLLWIEAKGGECLLSELLQGFIRVAYAVWYGGGKGLLAAPHDGIEVMKESREFLASISRSTERTLGLFDAEALNVEWL